MGVNVLPYIIGGSSHMVRTCIDLFAGAGGLSEGFRQEGYKILLVNYFDEYCETTYKLNH